MSISDDHVLADRSAMGGLMRALPWHGTPLGPPEGWPAELKVLVPVMLGSSHPMHIVWGPQRTLLYNDAYAALLGSKHPAALGKDALRVWEEIGDELRPHIEAAYRGETVRMDDLHVRINRHGTIEDAHFSFSMSPVRDADRAVAGFVCVCTDITARVTAETRLAANEARFRGVLANMGEAFVLFDHDFNIIELNEETTRLVGLDREETLGKNHWTLFPGTFDSELGRMYRRALKERKPGLLEHHYRFPDGREHWFEVRAYPVSDGLAVFFREVTQRRRMVEEAALAAERIQLALDAGAIMGTWMWSAADARFIADERWIAMMDIDTESAGTGSALATALDSVHTEDRRRVEKAVRAAFVHGGPFRSEFRARQRDGSYRWVEANGRVDLDPDGRPLRFPGIVLDIEDRRRTEAERDQATALLRTFIEAVPGVVYAKDRAGRLIVANRGTADLLGLPPESFIGRTDREVLADPAQAEAIMVADQRIMATGVAEQLEEWVQLPDGTPALWWSTKAPLRDESGAVTGLIGSSVDITDRKRMEEALRLSEESRALAMDVAQLGIWTWNIATGAVSADGRCREVCGLPPGDSALTLEQIAGRVHPEDWPRVEHALTAAMEPGGDGVYAEEFRWLHHDGSVRWSASRGVVQFDDAPGSRAPRMMIGSVIDVTERRHLVETLQQADRRKDEFLAMLAHELRNPLAPIGTAAQLLRIAPGDADKVQHAATIISRQVVHMTELVDDLLDVSRVTRGLVELDRAPVDLRTVVAAALEQAEPLLQARQHTLVTTSTAGTFTVLGDRHRLVQVVSNLLNNAAKYTPQGGRIEVRVEASADHATIRISDNGVGIDGHLLPHVFDLFAQGERTPDRTQGGLGIGLALVQRIVQLHDGTVHAASAGPNMGSVFTVTLPKSTHVVAPEPQSAERGEPHEPKKVLIVDDNVDAAATLADVLGLLGHEVSVAADGAAALSLAGQRRDWDAFILDIGLPDMTGHELARQLESQLAGSSATFIALTGYGQTQDRALSKAAGFHHHLVKPVDVDRIREILGTLDA